MPFRDDRTAHLARIDRLERETAELREQLRVATEEAALLKARPVSAAIRLQVARELEAERAVRGVNGSGTELPGTLVVAALLLVSMLGSAVVFALFSGH